MKRLWWVIGIVVAIPILAFAGLVTARLVGVVTVEAGAPVFWRDYPGVADVEPDEVLAAPSAEQALADGEAMVDEMRAALSEEFGLDWVGAPNDLGEYFFPVENGYGGRSLLVTINAPTAQSDSVPTAWRDKQRVIEIIAEITASHGYSAPVLDHERPYVTEEDRERDFGGATVEDQVFVSGYIEGPLGQWVFFGMQDPSKDVDGSFDERLTNGDWERASVTLSYGANALLPSADRAEFERRLVAFRGLTLPTPLED